MGIIKKQIIIEVAQCDICHEEVEDANLHIFKDTMGHSFLEHYLCDNCYRWAKGELT